MLNESAQERLGNGVAIARLRHLVRVARRLTRSAGAYVNVRHDAFIEVVASASAPRLGQIAQHPEMVPASESVCTLVIEQDRPLVIRDLEQSPLASRVQDAVNGGLRAYAGVPFADAQGRPLGTICVVDVKPRQWTKRDLRLLRECARLIRREVIRREARSAERQLSESSSPALVRRQQFVAAVAARRRAERLLEATVALSTSSLDEEVASAVAAHAARVLHADGAAVYALDERPQGRGLRLLRETGFEQGAVDDFGWLPLKAHVPVCVTARNGEPQLLRNPAALAGRYPNLAAEIARSGRSALAVFPMRVGDTVTGALAFAFNTPQDFATEDIAFATVLTEQCAQSLERSRLFQEEHAARRRAEALQTLAVALTAANTPQQVAAEAVARGMSSTRLAVSGVVALLDETESEFRIVTTPDVSADLLATWSRYPNAGDIPSAVAVRTRRPCYSRTREEYVSRAPGLHAIAEEIGLQAEAVLPLRVQGRTLGVISFSFSAPQRFDAAEDAFLRTVADLIAHMLDRAQLTEAEQEGRDRSERLLLLSQVLSSLTTLDDASRAIVHMGVDVLGASGAALYFLDEGRDLLRCHTSEAFDAEFAEAYRDVPLSAEIPVAVAARTRRAMFFSTPAEMNADYPHLVDVWTRMRLRSLCVLPLIVNTRLVGTLAFWFDAARALSADERTFVLAVAQHASVALERITLTETERHLREEAERIGEALQEAHRRKDEFLATLAHELRNPLAPIRNAMAVMQLPQTEAREQAWTHAVIERQVQQMTRLIDDLLDVSRISQGRLELQCAAVDLREVLELAFETSRPGIVEQHHRLHVELPDEPLIVFADTTRLAQVFSNLLNNAAKYMLHPGRITVRVRMDADRYLVDVEDQGIGIAAEQLDDVFELFSQVSPMSVRSHVSHRAGGGLGIGLSLVRQLTHLHGGTVTVQSSEQRGSTFTVHLPIHQAEPATELASEPTADAAPVDARSARAIPRRVLVVDDNVDAAESLALLLEAHGHSLTVAVTGAEALRMAAAAPPEFVLLDIGLPDMSGIEVCRALRESAATHRARIIALTGWGQASARQQTTDAEFDLHLVKPVHPTRILELLATQEGEWRAPLSPSAFDRPVVSADGA